MVIFLLVALPSTVGWKLVQKHDQFIRMAGAIVAGQMILTPGIVLIAFSEQRAGDENPAQTMIIYGAMALVISIMTFAILEIKKTHKDR